MWRPRTFGYVNGAGAHDWGHVDPSRGVDAVDAVSEFTGDLGHHGDHRRLCRCLGAVAEVVEIGRRNLRVDQQLETGVGAPVEITPWRIVAQRWLGLSEQCFVSDRWSVCPVQAAALCGSRVK